MNRFRLLTCTLSLLLAALLLAGCGAAPLPVSAPTPAPDPTPDVTAQPAAAAEDAIVVTQTDELLAALGHGALIEIDAAHLRLDDAADYGFGYSEGPYTWESIGDGEYELILRGLDALTIRGRGLGKTRLTTGDRYASVISFRDCDNLTLEGLTLGHRGEAGGCAGDVVSLADCDDAGLRDCELFGCGVIAVNAYACSRMRLDACLLRDCSAAAINAANCLDFQARDCEISNCGRSSSLGTICLAGCDGFALINSLVRDGQNRALLDAMNSTSVCLLGCEAEGNRFSDALFALYDRNITVSGCALSDNEFGACYAGGGPVAETGAGRELLTFADFARMEHKAFAGEYIGPPPHPSPTPRPVAEGAVIPPPGELREVHAANVEELLAAIAPRTTVYLDGEEFLLSSAEGYGQTDGVYYTWAEEYDGYTLVLRDLEDFSLVGQGPNITLLCTEPRYADVLRFENCARTALTELTMGHTPEPGFCTGDVLSLQGCRDASVSHCGFFGCGEVGLSASGCSQLLVTDSNLYDCSSYGAQLEYVSDMSFSGCHITNCGSEYYGANGIYSYNCSDVFYDNERINDGVFLVREEN